MSGRAKGPWRTVRYGFGDWRIFAGPERDEDGRLNLGVFCKMEDAWLASAAPDLLLAVEAMLSANRDDDTDMRKACRAAKAAIDKANGDDLESWDSV